MWFKDWSLSNLGYLVVDFINLGWNIACTPWEGALCEHPRSWTDCTDVKRWLFTWVWLRQDSKWTNNVPFSVPDCSDLKLVVLSVFEHNLLHKTEHALGLACAKLHYDTILFELSPQKTSVLITTSLNSFHQFSNYCKFTQ